MIKTFKSKETAKIFDGEFSRKLPHKIQGIAFDKLQILDLITNISELKVPPSNNLEKLKGDRHGQYSIRINKQWRICFNWKNNNAYNVEIIDYH